MVVRTPSAVWYVPAIGEPDKCSELVWANSAAVPADTIGYIRAALDAVAPGTPPLLSYGWDVSADSEKAYAS